MREKKEEKVNKKAIMETQIDIKDIIVIDCGTHTCKIGISGQHIPRVTLSYQLVIDSFSGTQIIKNQNDSLNAKAYELITSKKCFGPMLNQVMQQNKHPLSFEYPIQGSKITNYTQIEQMLNYVFFDCYSSLLVLQLQNNSLANVLFIDSPLNSKQYKCQIAERLFEGVKINSLLFMNSSTLSLFSTGITTGLVTELGHGTNTVVPVFEGFILPHAIQSSFISGQQITKVWSDELKQLQINLPQQNQVDHYKLITKIKQKMGSIALDFQQSKYVEDYSDIQQKTYQLPDGSLIQLPLKVRVKPAQILFNPCILQQSAIIDSKSLNLIEMLADSLSRCDPQLYAEMARNIVVCGGTSLIRGLPMRLRDELEKITDQSDINFIFHSQRRYSSWIGGSMLGSLSTFQDQAITISDYQQNQQNKMHLIHKKTL